MLIRLGHHGDGAGAGVDAALGFGRGHALHAVAAGLKAQRAVHARAAGAAAIGAFDAQHDFLVATEFRRALADHLDAPAHSGGVARVHARQVARKQGRLVAPGAGPDFQEGVACVVGVLRQQQALQFVFELLQLGFAAGDFVLRHLGHVGVLQHLAGTGQVGLALEPAGVAAGDLRDLGMLAREHAVLRHVGHDVFAREQEVELLQAPGVALQLVAEKRFHAEEVC